MAASGFCRKHLIVFKVLKLHLEHDRQQMGDPKGLAMINASEGLWLANLSGNSAGETQSEHCDFTPSHNKRTHCFESNYTISRLVAKHRQRVTKYLLGLNNSQK